MKNNDTVKKNRFEKLKLRVTDREMENEGIIAKRTDTVYKTINST